MQAQVRTAVRSRPSRLLVALAAAWVILSLAIGGAVHAGADDDLAQRPSISATTDGSQH